MSLSASEQEALDSIKDSLAGSDPQLAALLTTFTQLASAEEMPAQETILADRVLSFRAWLTTTSWPGYGLATCRSSSSQPPSR